MGRWGRLIGPEYDGPSPPRPPLLVFVDPPGRPWLKDPPEGPEGP